MTEEQKWTEAVETVTECGGSPTKAARRLGIPRGTLYSRLRQAKERLGLEPTDAEGEAIASEKSSLRVTGDIASLVVTTRRRIRTIEDALDYAEVDRDMWEVHTFDITSHEQAQKSDDGDPIVIRLWNVKARLKRRSIDHPLRVKDDVMRMLTQYSPKIPAPKWARRKNRGEIMVEISVPDIHFGKLADAEETGEDYNLDIASRLYDKAYDHLLGEAAKAYDIGLVLNVPSNDIMHYSGSRYTTTAGIRQDSCAVWQRTYRTAREAMVRGTLKCRDVAPVKSICHSDNHAQDESFYLGDALWCYFNNDKHVEVDAGMAPYKFHRHGNCLIGLGHGHQAKYPELQSIMAKMRPRDFAECSVKEYHMGHLHKEMMIDSWGDLVLRRIGSLSATDAWHMGMGYCGRKSAQAFIWSREGLEATIYFTPSPEDYQA